VEPVQSGDGRRLGRRGGQRERQLPGQPAAGARERAMEVQHAVRGQVAEDLGRPGGEACPSGGRADREAPRDARHRGDREPGHTPPAELADGREGDHEDERELREQQVNEEQQDHAGRDYLPASRELPRDQIASTPRRGSRPWHHLSRHRL
jgi:hypothetical protein